MKLILVLLCTTLQALAVDRIQLQFPSNEIRQGAIVQGALLIDPSSLDLPVQKLTGTNFSETIYFHKISPLLKKEASEKYVSEVQVIFSKVPESDSLSGKIGERDVVLQWTAIRVVPMEAPGQMIWADFTAPELWKGLWRWIALVVLSSVLAFGGYRLWRRFDEMKKENLI